MGKKLYRSIAYDKDGNITLEGTYGSNFRTFSNEEANKRLREEREIDFKNKVLKLSLCPFQCVFHIMLPKTWHRKLDFITIHTFVEAQRMSQYDIITTISSKSI